MGIGAKYNFIFIVLMLFLSVLIGYLVSIEVKSAIKKIAIEKAKSDVLLSYQYLDQKYPGDWKIENNQMYKGKIKINDNDEIVDHIGNITKDTVTIFQGNTRITTNVMKDGKRIIGTQVSKEVENVVLTGGKAFYGEANVVGRFYQSAYIPIQNTSGEIIGIYYVGTSQELIDTTNQSILKSLSITLIFTLLLSIVVIFVFTKRLKKRLNTIAQAFEEAGQGNFTVNIHDSSSDEISTLGQGFNHMRDNLKRLIEKVIHHSEQVTDASHNLTETSKHMHEATEQISLSIQKVSWDADKQAASTQEAYQISDEICKGMNQAASTIQTVAQATIQADEKASLGYELVEQTRQQMNHIEQIVKEMVNSVDSLSEKTKQIDHIAGLITQISSQTNLLALNAAIEAARAGEQGKGFSVVAGEVRNLAEQSRAATEDIRLLIEEINKETDHAKGSVTQSTDMVKQGMDLVHQTGAAFESIVSMIRDISAQSGQVSAVVTQVSSGSNQVVVSMEGISRISNETSGYSQQVAAATQEQHASMESIITSANTLDEIAKELQEIVKQFKI